MSDPRLTPFNGRVAHVTLQGKVAAEHFVAGTDMAPSVTLTPILRVPGGAMDRELLFGQTFVVLEMPDDPEQGFAFGYAARDGYCGYVKAADLGAAPAVTHIVNVRETYGLAAPDLKEPIPRRPFYFGSCLAIEAVQGDWSRIGGAEVYFPSCHLRPIDACAPDPVGVARLFLGTPYVWGGNSGAGLDCSGLVQAAFHACGYPCPGDSDLQAAMPGRHLGAGEPLEAGDLLFWKGHVAMATGAGHVVHANAHHMAVVEEELESAVQRIAKTDTGPVTLRLRPSVLTEP